MNSAILFDVVSTLPGSGWIYAGVVLLAILCLALLMFGVRYIPNDRIGIIEKFWSPRGSVRAGRIIALGGEAGYQSDILRGGVHFFLGRWQHRIHKAPLVTIPQGKIGYVYARDGDALQPSQTLARWVDCNSFQDARAFLATGQRGRQRAILREGVYAINLALFVVITEDVVFHLSLQGRQELEKLLGWQNELRQIGGFDPVVIGQPLEANDPLVPGKTFIVDSIGIVTTHDGPSLSPGEIIAPAVGNDPKEPDYHNNYQDPDAFLRSGGRRGRQYVPLTDGTYFINRWFATIELIPKTVVPVGYVGVVVSYYGPPGQDVSGDAFRHGERVARGERGVWDKPFGPGKYPFNTYAGQMIFVPTTNFVLHWITGKSEAHQYDDKLQSIDIVTKDAYEPTLPLSVVVHIDYMKAPSVIQRFGDVKRLITQTLDPMLSAYFRDVAHRKTMLELLHDRETIQSEARDTLRKRFLEFDMECVDVLIGKPDTAEAGGKIETLLEQLRIRQLSIEQLETFERQSKAAEKQRALNEQLALAQKQTELTASQVQVRIAENAGDADLSRARKQAEQQVVMAQAELAKSRHHAEQLVVTAQAESQQRVLAGKGEGQRLLQIGLAEASVLMQKVASYGDPRLYALSLVAEHLSKSEQPLVPQHMFVSGVTGDGAAAVPGPLGTLVNLLVAEKTGFKFDGNGQSATMKELAEKLTRQAMEAMQGAENADRPGASAPNRLASIPRT
ncbi:MAG TPA: SPFH domain-containing protein [Tepidisphaeraceae bacterium]|nr:SPFH domain-containing protein [Tepidisphaeraceae bacterium]